MLTLAPLSLPNTIGAFSVVLDLSALSEHDEITFAVPSAGAADVFQVYFTTNPSATSNQSATTGPLLTGPTPAPWQPPIPGRYVIVQRIAGTTTSLSMQSSGQETPGSGASTPSTGTYVPIANLPSGGSIGLAPATVDVSSYFTVNQTTGGQAITLPAPTQTAPARLAIVENVGTQSFTLYGSPVLPGYGAVLGWNGSAWTVVAIGSAVAAGTNAFGRVLQIGTTDNFALGLYTNSTVALVIDTAQNVGINQGTPKARLDVNGAVLLEPVSVANLAGGGSVGSAATTVDVASVLEINQTTGGQAVTLPPPTNAAAHGRYLCVVNVGTASFLVGDATLQQNVNLMPGAAGSKGQGCIFMWNGTAWVPLSAFYPIPAQGANLGDANVTVTRAGAFSQYTMPGSSMSANRTVTLPSAAQGALPGDVALISRLDTTAFSLTVANGGPGAGNIAVLPASKQNFAMAWFNGTNWIFMSCGVQ